MAKPNVSFAHDFDSDLYMLSDDPDARKWTVLVHCGDERTHELKIEKFMAYPGCTPHDDKVAWPVEYFRAETIEIQCPGEDPVIMKHPDA